MGIGLRESDWCQKRPEVEYTMRTIVKVINILHRHWLCLKAEKCMFRQPTVEYLGLILLEDQVEMDPIKIASICDWSPVICWICQLLLAINPRLLTCGQAPAPAHQERRGLEMDWDCTRGFLRTQMAHNVDPHSHATQPRHAILTENGCFWVHHKGSTISTMLRQQVASGRVHIQKLSDVERNYEIHDKELLSVIQGLEEWQHILEGKHNRDPEQP